MEGVPVNALPEQTEAASLRRQLEATQKRLDAELQRCGTAEGALAVMEATVKTLRARVAQRDGYIATLERNIRRLEGEDEGEALDERYDTWAEKEGLT